MSIKLKLIDVLDIIESGELEEGARVIWDFKEYIYDGRDSLWRESEYSGTEGRDIFEDICLGNLREEVELIEPKKNKECEHEWKFSGVRDIIDPTIVTAYEYCEKCGMTKIMETKKQGNYKKTEHLREDTKMIEDTNTTEKIEELDEKYIPWLDLVKDINKIIRKLNVHSKVLLAQEKDINEIKEQLDY